MPRPQYSDIVFSELHWNGEDVEQKVRINAYLRNGESYAALAPAAKLVPIASPGAMTQLIREP